MLALMCGIGTLHAQEHKNAVGFNLAYAKGGKGISNFGIGVKYDYSLSEALRVEPSFIFYFDNDKISQKDASINFHYLFNLDAEEKFHLYPIFGFSTLFGHERNVAKIDKQGNPVYKDGVLQTENDSFFRFGCNLGVGVQYDITDDFGLVGECRYKIAKDFGQTAIAVGCVVTF